MEITTTYNRCIACHGHFAAGADGSLSARVNGSQYDLCPKHGAEYEAMKAARQLENVPLWAQRFAVLESDETADHPRRTNLLRYWYDEFTGEFPGGDGLY